MARTLKDLLDLGRMDSSVVESKVPINSVGCKMYRLAECRPDTRGYIQIEPLVPASPEHQVVGVLLWQHEADQVYPLEDGFEIHNAVFPRPSRLRVSA